MTSTTIASLELPRCGVVARYGGGEGLAWGRRLALHELRPALLSQAWRARVLAAAHDAYPLYRELVEMYGGSAPHTFGHEGAPLR